MKVLFATTNEGKLREVKAILADYGIDVVSLKSEGIDVIIKETGSTFIENAIIKARTIAEIANTIVLADDSGLEVDFINKEPGIYSARYLGEETPQSVKNKSIIQRLENASGNERSARFVCGIAIVFPNGRILTTEGTVEGLIAYEEKGENGFGYDSIFYIPAYNLTIAQMSEEQKNTISHRFKALRLMGEKLKLELSGGNYENTDN